MVVFSVADASKNTDYHKVYKFWDARNFCCDLTQPKIQTKRPNLKEYLVKKMQME